MKKKSILFAFFVIIFVVSLIVSCSKKEQVNNVLDPNLIEEITPFQIERLEPIAIRFAKTMQVQSQDAILLSPNQKGEWSFPNEKTAVFTPSEPYKPNSNIKLSVNSKKILGEGENFSYTFFVKGASYRLSFEGLEINDDSGFSLRGVLFTDIPLSKDEVDGSVLAEVKSESSLKKLAVQWEQDEKTDAHNFTITSGEDRETASTLTVSWNGKKFGLSSKEDEAFAGSQTFNIPSKHTFSVISVDSSQERKVIVSFSDSLDNSQEMLGYIHSEKRKDVEEARLTYSVNKNILTIFNDDNWKNISRLVLLPGIQSQNGSYLMGNYEIPLKTSWDIPEVRFSTSGNILPTSQGTTLAIETKNLAGLSFRVFEIYDTNMLQFLQVNELDGDYRLEYVSEPVYTERVTFDWDESMQNVFVPRGIDISNLVKKYPEGMFRIQLGFKHEDIRYVCSANHRDFSSLPEPPDIADKNYNRDLQWEHLNVLEWEDRRTYWQSSDDPCHPAFYMESYGDHFASRNIIVSDVGIIAKKTETKDLYVTVTNLKTASPLKDANVSLYSKINRPIASAKTDSNGFAVFKNVENAFLVLASANNHSSYLKLTEGAALSVSHFETGGEKVQAGAKGFIYGERGVWRPGDNLYLTFVLQDLEKKIPKEIPLIFELQDPLGKIVDRQTLSNNVNGFYAITTKTSQNAQTGLYLARIKLGGNEWSRGVRIESIIPNHLDVKLESTQKYVGRTNNRFTLSGKWLHGAATPNYRADVAMRLLPSKTSFDGYSSYTFDNIEYSVDSTRSTVWEGRLDSSSRAQLSLDFDDASEKSGMLRAQFISRIFEPSGMFSTQQTTFDFSPYSRYCGLRLPEGKSSRKILYTDEVQNVDVVLLTEDGRLVNNADLRYSIYKLDWKWWWEKDALSSATFVSSESKKVIDSGTVQIRQGKGAFNFNIKRTDWGRYLIVVQDVQGGHSASEIAYIDWPDWSGRSSSGDAASATIVPLTTDKNQYTVGDTANLSFTTSDDSRALVTIEKSGQILKQEWIETKKGTTVYKLPLTDKMAPNVYVHVTLVQSHLQTANSLPIRLYGVVPLIVDNPATKLTPVITTPASYEPGKKSKITVQEQNGKAMTFTLAVVDEGLLGITNFNSPILRDEFYKKEASLLENWDLYGYVMNAYSGKLETLLSVGGSEELLDTSAKNNSRFTPVVFYFGPYELKSNARQEIEFEMPQYIGAVRAMLIAGHNGAYGTTEKSVPVKSDLMVLPQVPRVLGLNETIDIPVTIFNGTDRAQNVSVKFDASGSISSSQAKNITLSPNSNAETYFTISANTQGSATLTTNANSAGVNAKNTTNVEVKSRGMQVSYREVFAVEPGKSYTATVQTPGDRASAKLIAELSPFPSVDLSARLEYLLSYPHGCIEQITSAAFPQLYLSNFTNLSQSQVEDVKKNVSSVIERYPNYQTSAGGFAYWQGGTEPNVWGSCYAAHFLISAKNFGYSVPDSLLSPLLSWIARSAKNWTLSDYDTTDIQAYKLFVLAEARQADIGSMNRLRSEKIKDSAKLLLSAAYSRAGRANVSEDLFNQVNDITTIGRATGGSFYSPLRDKSIMLYVSQIVGNGGTSARLAKQIAEDLSSRNWCSTQETAWALLSLLSFYSGQKGGICSYLVQHENGKASGTVSAGIVTENFVLSNTSEQRVLVQNTGNRILYGTLLATGLSLPATETRQSSGITMDVVYYDSNGTRIYPQNIKVGDSFRIAVSVTNRMSGTIENIALTLPIPSAWEFSNDRVGEGEASSARMPYTNQDIRDDAIYTYFDLKSGQTFTYTFYATSVYSGKYYVPAIYVVAMYDNDIRSVEPGLRIGE